MKVLLTLIFISQIILMIAFYCYGYKIADRLYDLECSDRVLHEQLNKLTPPPDLMLQPIVRGNN